MRIGLNCLRTAPQYKGGINSFTFGLLDGFAASKRQHDFVIFATPNNRDMFDAYVATGRFKLVEITESPKRRRLITNLDWQVAYRLPLRLLNKIIYAPYARIIEAEADVVYVPHGPTPFFPYPRIPTVYSIHDLQHIHFPQFFTEEQRLERDAILAACKRHASLLQATSQQMKDEFLAHFRFLKPEQVPVIPEGVDVAAFSDRKNLTDLLTRYRLPKEFLFYPAQLWPHKNHITILKALVQARENGLTIPLVLTGARYPGSQSLFDFIAENKLDDQVHYLGVVPYSDIIALHQAARFMITASVYEAGSIPMLEAAAAGTAIIGSATPSHTEHSRDLQMQLFPPVDHQALADLLASVWGDDALILRQTQINLTAIQKFTWQRASERYLDVLESLVRRP